MDVWTDYEAQYEWWDGDINNDKGRNDGVRAGNCTLLATKSSS